MGFISSKMVKKPILNPLKAKKRMSFSRKFLRWSVADWSRVIFSDEKVFSVRPGGTLRCWRPKTASKFVGRYVQNVVQKAESIMVWAAINGKGKVIVRRCPRKVKAVDYQGILSTALRFISPRYSNFNKKKSFFCAERRKVAFNRTVHQCTRQGAPFTGLPQIMFASLMQEFGLLHRQT
jgi:hypothetical protein